MGFNSAFKVLKAPSRHQRRGTEKNHRKCDSRKSASRRTF